MKKIIALLIVLVFAFSSVSYAGSLVDVIPASWKALTFDNTTGDYVGYSVPTTTIVPDINMILGVCVVPLADATSHSESLVGLYDGVGGASIVSDEIFDEAEADGTSSTPFWYPYPRKILTQLMVHVGPNTRAIVYWE